MPQNAVRPKNQLATDRLRAEGNQRTRRRRLGREGFTSERRSAADMEQGDPMDGVFKG